VEGVRAFQPALQANRTLREFIHVRCELGNEGIRFLADAPVSNTIMDNLFIGVVGVPSLLLVLPISRDCSNRHSSRRYTLAVAAVLRQ
jgi:hypothetical protein